MKTKLPNIYVYNNARQYLADYQKARQRDERKFTKSRIGKLIGLPRTRSYFSDVIRGKRITPIFVERFIDIFALDKDEADYFRVLVKYNQSENSHEREIYFEQLISLNKTPRKTLSKDLFAYYTHWYNSVVRAVINSFKFSNNYKELAQKVYPNISIKQAKESVRLLVKLGLIKQDINGHYILTDKSIATPDYVKHDLVKSYQMKCLELARRAILHNQSLPQTIATNTISISEQGYKRLERKINKFRSEVRSLIHKDEGKAEKVYQLHIQLFPTSI